MPPVTRLLIGGFLTLAVAMGVGRFFYTPLLPLMQRDFGFDTATAGLIASANFAGYLVGSIAASFLPVNGAKLLAFRVAIVASVATTIAMGLSGSLPAWLALRFASGVASAFALILAAGYVAEALGRIGEDRRLGWMFGGVGFGIAASTLLVRLAGDALGPAALWIAAGLACMALLPIIWREVGARDLPHSASRDGRPGRAPRPMPFWPLFASYVCEGLGYSVFATFIVAIVKSRPGLEALADWVWVITGLAGLPSCLLWAWAAERIGFGNALILAFLAQIAGVVLPALSNAGGPALIAAILFGGTFMAISVLTLPLGRHGLNGRGFAVLTAGFGLGQMLGPLIAGRLVAGPADYNTALLASAGVLAIGTACLLAGVLARRNLVSTGA
jgi:predicted MFS family arabinose efflux permease